MAVNLPWDTLRERARAHLALQTAAHSESWHLDESDWKVDLGDGIITFTNPRFTATAPVQVIGSRDPRDNSWLWAWEHPSVPAHLASDARAVRDYGASHDLPALTTAMVSLDEHDPWDFVAAADLLAGAQGGYRGPTGAAEVFMTFGTVTLGPAR